MSDDIPELYKTEKTPAQLKIIYQKWEIPSLGFYWLIAELDKKNNLAYGYANLNDDLFAEWGFDNLRILKPFGPSRSEFCILSL